tara:strand:+ start:328 stop:477 length:150 start_codon:yes stop_codon:yes gene_type:complete
MSITAKAQQVGQIRIQGSKSANKKEGVEFNKSARSYHEEEAASIRKRKE